MPATHKYFHDKAILILLGVNYFLAFFSSILILLRLGNNGQASNYIIQYRSNLGITAFKTGNVINLLSFIVFAVLVAAVHTVLSIKTYHIKRELSVIILSFGIVLLLIAIIVSNALLVLR